MFLKKYFSSLFDPQYRIPMASAALSYYLIMTFFPLLIILYNLLGNNYGTALRVLEHFDSVIPDESMAAVRSFLEYVSMHNSNVLTYFAWSAIIAGSSAAFRSLQTNIGIMQGGLRHKGFASLVFSVLLSLLFIVLVYLAITILFCSEYVLEFLNSYVPYVHLKRYWNYLLLFCLAFIIIFFIFLFSGRKDVRFGVFWGALLSTVCLAGVCYVFSLFIGKSVKYPVVYSSFSSIILLMFWLYCCSYCIYCGALFNAVLYRHRMQREVGAGSV